MAPKRPVRQRNPESAVHRRLLILSCSKRKQADPSPLPAIDRYDGPRFRVLRKYLRHHADDGLDVLILSARFGIIRSERMIDDYDQIMTEDRAKELRPRVAVEFGEAFAATEGARMDPDKMLICMGTTYVSALDGVDEPTRSLLRSRVAGGSQGKQLALLKAWLNENRPPPDAQAPVAGMSGSIRFAGEWLTLSHEQAVAAIHQIVASKGETMPQPQVWCVKVDGRGVPVKWVMSHLTGVPVQSFTTGQAQAALARLGIAAEPC